MYMHKKRLRKRNKKLPVVRIDAVLVPEHKRRRYKFGRHIMAWNYPLVSWNGFIVDVFGNR
jgi:hypothetical protein